MKDQKMSVFLIFILILKIKDKPKLGNPTLKLAVNLIVNILMYIKLHDILK